MTLLSPCLSVSFDVVKTFSCRFFRTWQPFLLWLQPQQQFFLLKTTGERRCQLVKAFEKVGMQAYQISYPWSFQRRLRLSCRHWFAYAMLRAFARRNCNHALQCACSMGPWCELLWKGKCQCALWRWWHQGRTGRRPNPSMGCSSESRGPCTLGFPRNWFFQGRC